MKNEFCLYFFFFEKFEVDKISKKKHLFPKNFGPNKDKKKKG